MAIQTLAMLRTEVKFRFIEYLKTSKAPYYEPELTVCPHCGQHASIISDFMWSCNHCNRNGDVVDYVTACHGFRTEADAIKHVCRVLGIKIRFLDTVSADDLMDMQFPNNPELIEKMLGKGLYLLAGASKIGKSWLVLWMAHCISLGMPIWEFKTRKSGVLYLSLEDTHQRIQRRLVDVCGGETGMLDISTDAELLGSGLEEQLNNYLHDHPDTKLIIIDTLQRIRHMKADSYSYAGDYATLTALKQIADRFDMTILLVHHTRKQDADDAVDKISGTTGLIGCADGSLILEKENRLETRGSLTITSREHPDRKLLLDFDKDTKIWKFLGYADIQEEAAQEPILAAVAAFVQDKKQWKGTATELLDSLLEADSELIVKPNTLVRKLNAKSKELHDRYGILYTWKRMDNVKYLILQIQSDKSDTCDNSGGPDIENTEHIAQSD